MNLAQILPLILYLVSLLPTSCPHGHCLLEQPALWFLAVYKQDATSRYLARFLQIPLTSSIDLIIISWGTLMFWCLRSLFVQFLSLEKSFLPHILPFSPVQALTHVNGCLLLYPVFPGLVSGGDHSCPPPFSCALLFRVSYIASCCCVPQLGDKWALSSIPEDGECTWDEEGLFMFFTPSLVPSLWVCPPVSKGEDAKWTPAPEGTETTKAPGPQDFQHKLGFMCP